MDTSEQVASASCQVSSASRQLADGAFEQAASIEETASALESMTSMTKQNAGNAVQANELTRESGKIVGEANRTMSLLTASMTEISGASEQTQKIVKTIDEIAFQTNLLALNAAVEAARAGEAGAGFAVVADEVRNLAMRAAEAARNTAGMIESTVAKVKEGSSLVDKTNLDFRRVAGCVAKSEELIGEIAAASHEQSQGIEQINGAIANMNKVIQQNSANAEESSSASELMAAQARNLEDYLQELLTLVGGKTDTGAYRCTAGEMDRPADRKQLPDAHAMPQTAKTIAAANPAGAGDGRPSSLTDSSKVIPFDEDTMDSF